MRRSFRAVHKGDDPAKRVEEVTNFLRNELGLDVTEDQLCAKASRRPNGSYQWTYTHALVKPDGQRPLHFRSVDELASALAVIMGKAGCADAFGSDGGYSARGPRGGSAELEGTVEGGGPLEDSSGEGSPPFGADGAAAVKPRSRSGSRRPGTSRPRAGAQGAAGKRSGSRSGARRPIYHHLAAIAPGAAANPAATAAWAAQPPMMLLQQCRSVQRPSTRAAGVAAGLAADLPMHLAGSAGYGPGADNECSAGYSPHDPSTAEHIAHGAASALLALCNHAIADEEEGEGEEADVGDEAGATAGPATSSMPRLGKGAAAAARAVTSPRRAAPGLLPHGLAANAVGLDPSAACNPTAANLAELGAGLVGSALAGASPGALLAEAQAFATPEHAAAVAAAAVAAAEREDAAMFAAIAGAFRAFVEGHELFRQPGVLNAASLPSAMVEFLHRQPIFLLAARRFYPAFEKLYGGDDAVLVEYLRSQSAQDAQSVLGSVVGPNSVALGIGAPASTALAAAALAGGLGPRPEDLLAARLGAVAAKREREEEGAEEDGQATCSVLVQAARALGPAGAGAVLRRIACGSGDASSGDGGSGGATGTQALAYGAQVSDHSGGLGSDDRTGDCVQGGAPAGHPHKRACMEAAEGKGATSSPCEVRAAQALMSALATAVTAV